MRGEKEGKQWQNAEGEIAKRDLDIYIGAPQRMDPAIMVTLAINVLPNGPISLYDGMLQIPPNGTAPQWLPPKKTHPGGRKTNHHGPSFRRKVSSVCTAAGSSRERRLTHRLCSSSRVRDIQREVETRHALRTRWEYSRQGQGGRRGIPTKGGIEPLDSIE